MTTTSKRMESLTDLAEILCEQNDFDEVLRLVALKATSFFKAQSTSLMMINPRTRQTIKTTHFS